MVLIGKKRRAWARDLGGGGGHQVRMVQADGHKLLSGLSTQPQGFQGWVEVCLTLEFCSADSFYFSYKYFSVERSLEVDRCVVRLSRNPQEGKQICWAEAALPSARWNVSRALGVGRQVWGVYATLAGECQGGLGSSCLGLSPSVVFTSNKAHIRTSLRCNVLLYEDWDNCPALGVYEKKLSRWCFKSMVLKLKCVSGHLQGFWKPGWLSPIPAYQTQ